MFWITSENSEAVRASCNGDGSPLAFVRPVFARPHNVAIIASKRRSLSTGLNSTITLAGTSPAFDQSCGVPAAASAASPGPNCPCWPAIRVCSRPLTTVNRSSIAR